MINICIRRLETISELFVDCFGNPLINFCFYSKLRSKHDEIRTSAALLEQTTNYQNSADWRLDTKLQLLDAGRQHKKKKMAAG